MRGALADLLKGIVSGVAFALVFLAIGVIRAAIVLLFGHARPSIGADVVRLIAYYIGAFAFAGGLVGLARPYATTDARTYVAYGIAGSAGMLVLAMALDGGRRHWLSIVLEVGAGAMIGCAMAHGILSSRAKSRTLPRA
jgi:hypothetical protein